VTKESFGYGGSGYNVTSYDSCIIATKRERNGRAGGPARKDRKQASQLWANGAILCTGLPRECFTNPSKKVSDLEHELVHVLFVEESTYMYRIRTMLDIKISKAKGNVSAEMRRTVKAGN
jgi:hypothetical protein